MSETVAGAGREPTDAAERIVALAAAHLRIDRVERPDKTDWDDMIVGWDDFRAALSRAAVPSDTPDWTYEDDYALNSLASFAKQPADARPFVALGRDQLIDVHKAVQKLRLGAVPTEPGERERTR